MNYAVWDNDYNKVKKLLDLGTNPNKVRIDYTAIMKINPDILTLLLNYGLDPNILVNGSHLLLMYYHALSSSIFRISRIKNKNIFKCMKTLLDFHANPNLDKYHINSLTTDEHFAALNLLINYGVVFRLNPKNIIIRDRTPLDIVKKIIKLCLDSGLSINKINITNASAATKRYVQDQIVIEQIIALEHLSRSKNPAHINFMNQTGDHAVSDRVARMLFDMV